MAAPERKLPSDWCELEIVAGVNPNAPGIYLWQIGDDDTYIGKYSHLTRPTREYRRNVEKILNGLAYRKSKPGKFRAVHHALAKAVTDGRRIKLTILENVQANQLAVRERELILSMKCSLNR